MLDMEEKILSTLATCFRKQTPKVLAKRTIVMLWFSLENPGGGGGGVRLLYLLEYLARFTTGDISRFPVGHQKYPFIWLPDVKSGVEGRVAHLSRDQQVLIVSMVAIVFGVGGLGGIDKVHGTIATLSSNLTCPRYSPR
jgi:hypothetical protein